jgi:hypothetical protein
MFENKPFTPHPAETWQQASQGAGQDRLVRLRLAAMAGHMRQDMVTARRAALIDLLSEGRPFRRQEIWEAVMARIGRSCWGKRPHETLWRDLRALRNGGVRVAYSRRPGVEGYYLQYPPLKGPPPALEETKNWSQIRAIRHMSVGQKNRQAFAAAEFAYRQKRLILAQEHPSWSEHKLDGAARRLVFGSHEVAPSP